jgi:hypothetical protein
MGKTDSGMPYASKGFTFPSGAAVAQAKTPHTTTKASFGDMTLDLPEYSGAMADHNIRQRPVVGGAVESSGKAVRLSDENPIWEPKVQAKSAGLVNARCLKISAAVAVTVVVGFCLWIRSVRGSGVAPDSRVYRLFL